MDNSASPTMDAFRSALLTELTSQEQSCSRRVARWNRYYYATLFGSIILAAVSALLPKLDSISNVFVKRDLPSIFAATAALFTTLMHAGSFERRWRASRVRKARTQEICVRLLDPSVDVHAARKDLENVIAAYNEEILGATTRDTSHSLR